MGGGTRSRDDLHFLTRVSLTKLTDTDRAAGGNSSDATLSAIGYGRDAALRTPAGIPAGSNDERAEYVSKLIVLLTTVAGGRLSIEWLDQPTRGGT